LSRKGIDIKSLKRIPESQVPKKTHARGTPWEAMFRSIAKGEAIVLPSEDVSPSTVREALRRLQAKGQLTQLYLTTRKVGRNKYMTYVVNPSEEQTAQ